jgi:hypothetical protein
MRKKQLKNFVLIPVCVCNVKHEMSVTTYVNHPSRWLHGLRSRSAVVRLLRLRVRIPPKYGCLSLVSGVCCQRSLRRADHSSRGVLPNAVCLNECDLETWTIRRPWIIRAVEPWKKETYINLSYDVTQVRTISFSVLTQTNIPTTG